MKKNNISDHLLKFIMGYIALALSSATILFAINLAKVILHSLSPFKIIIAILLSYLTGCILLKKYS